MVTRRTKGKGAVVVITPSPLLLLAFIVVVYLIASIKILAEYERGVIFRLGKLLPQPKGPGIILVFAPIDRIVRVSLRTVALEVPPQDVITRDNVSVKVSAVLYYRVIDPRRAIVEVEHYQYATQQLAQTTLRSVLGQAELDDLLSERDRDRIVRVSLRTVALEVPPQDVITRDNVSVKVSAVLYYRVIDPRRAIVEVEHYQYATQQLAQTTLRSVLGQAELDDLLSERD